MKSLLSLVILVFALAACNNPDADKASTGNAKNEVVIQGTEYPVDSTSAVQWTGTKPTGSHVGTFTVPAGHFLVNDNALVGGTFDIDMGSLSNIDLASEPKQKSDLEGHLKSPDFFDVAKHPTSKFTITSVAPFVADSTGTEVILQGATHTITGNLTLKDSTQSISFPAKVTVDATSAAASANFNIDRSKWGINYKGPNHPQDWVISKTVNIVLDLKGTKK